MSVVDFGRRQRIANLTGTDRCAACDDMGIVEIEDETYGAQLVPTAAGGEIRELTARVCAPCPRCEAGYRFEHQPGAPWGDHGYWGGREIPERLA